MFCPKCGKEITGTAKFCPYCGAQFQEGSAPSEPAAPAEPASPAPESPVYSAPSAPESPAYSAPSAPVPPVYTAPQGAGSFDASAVPAGGGKKRLGAGLIIGGIVAVVLVAALAVALFGGLFSSPKSQLVKALAKTADAYAAAQKNVDLPDMTKLFQSGSYSQRVSLSLDSFSPEVTAYSPELASLKGMGLRLNMDRDQDGRKMDADMALFWDNQDLLSFQVLVDDNKMYFAAPDFTGDSAYGFNTETMGADLVRLGAEDDEINISSISFNIFDLAERFSSGDTQDEESAKAHLEAWQQLSDAIEVKKGGKQTIEVNGRNVDATVYHVVVPGDAMKEYIDAMADAMKAADTGASVEEWLEAIGLDRNSIQALVSEMEEVDTYGELARELRDMADSIGDMELEVYVSGGYVSAVEYSDRIDGTKVEVGLYLGGGDNYVDDWSLSLNVGGEKVSVESTGNHGGRDGVFTDETTIRADGTRLTSVLRYEPKASDGNFEWELKVDGTASMAVEGQLTLTESVIDLQIDEISFKAAGSKLFTMKGAYYLGPCDGMKVSFSSPKLLAEMSEGELLSLYFDIMNNGEAWSESLMDRLPPELSYYLY